MKKILFSIHLLMLLLQVKLTEEQHITIEMESVGKLDVIEREEDRPNKLLSSLEADNVPKENEETTNEMERKKQKCKKQQKSSCLRVCKGILLFSGILIIAFIISTIVFSLLGAVVLFMTGHPFDVMFCIASLGIGVCFSCLLLFLIFKS